MSRAWRRCPQQLIRRMLLPREVGTVQSPGQDSPKHRPMRPWTKICFSCQARSPHVRAEPYATWLPPPATQLAKGLPRLFALTQVFSTKFFCIQISAKKVLQGLANWKYPEVRLRENASMQQEHLKVTLVQEVHSSCCYCQISAGIGTSFSMTRLHPWF